MSIGLMTPADLEQVSGKKRYSTQAKWFKTQFDVDVPRRADGSIVLTWETFRALSDAKVGLRTPEPAPAVRSTERPPVYLLKKA
ncbi:hypothetical protein WJ92_02550 [Burkholderia ubonensis]|uniref:DUF4224 domain-containing protein n=1 Tax=Burkholderia ubonensis TaxID=101571 RepID=UPI000757D1F2|nr:DUF4224 domain-containing protein [Burkholderia ubonensis]KVP77480.1 hypothetical protein WJ92_02550 [Burkholderia ubonensis]KVU48166.1 hypothetical protein WK69_10675 [Burkholderia ubonensis]